MTGEYDDLLPGGLDDFYDDKGNPIHEKLEGLFEVYRYPHMTDEEYETMLREDERRQPAREAEKQLEGEHISEIVRLARDGDKTAQLLALRQASQLIYTGKPLPPPLNSYISASLLRHANGTAWSKAFASEKEGRIGRKALLKAGNDTLLVAIVDEAVASGLVKAIDGEPGPAFDEAAAAFCISSTQARKRYYEHLKRTGGAKMPLGEIVRQLFGEGRRLPNSEKNGKKG